MSLIAATQLTAVFTALLGVGAIVTGAFAILAFRKQSQEVSVLQQQVRDQQEVNAREADRLRRAQASMVFMTLQANPEDILRANVTNSSQQPIYETEVWWCDSQPYVMRTGLSTMMPGQAISTPGKFDPRPPNSDGCQGVVSFRDGAGTYWVRNAVGYLKERPPGTWRIDYTKLDEFIDAMFGAAEPVPDVG
jgi:hypothetical protein